MSKFLKSDLTSITTLDIEGASELEPMYMQDLKGIERFINLKKLIIRYSTNMLNINDIEKSTNIENLTLTNCYINLTEPIKKLSNLNILNLSNNNISSLKPLENLKNLTELNLENNAISDRSSYTDTDGSVKNYRNLDILANLNKNGKLKRLYLSGNDNIIDWSPLSSLNWEDKSGW